MRTKSYKHWKLLEKPLIIYGASSGGEEINLKIKKLGAETAYFCDSSKNKQGLRIDGKEIISPEELVRRFSFDGVNIIIGSNTYYYEIRNYLLSLGINRQNILPYNIDVYLESDCKVEPILLNNEQQRMLKDVMTELLLVMHQICEKHGIKYYLYGGTLLGAIRHKGFIPWDDDIDVVMFREEYDRFFKICESELPKEYYITPSENKLTPMITHKLRKCNTVRRYVQKDEHLPGRPVGICIDIFPLDNVKKKNGITERFQECCCVILAEAMKLKLGRSLELKNISRLLSKCLSALNKAQLMKILYKVLTLHNSKQTRYVFYFCPCYGYRDARTFERGLFRERLQAEFEGHFLWIPKEYHKILCMMYGENYMEFPPKNEQYQSHPTTELVI